MTKLIIESFRLVRASLCSRPHNGLFGSFSHLQEAAFLELFRDPRNFLLVGKTSVFFTFGAANDGKTMERCFLANLLHFGDS